MNCTFEADVAQDESLWVVAQDMTVPQSIAQSEATSTIQAQGDSQGTQHETHPAQVEEVPLDMEEVFEQVGASSERLQIMKRSELNAFACTAEKENQLPPDVRGEVLNFIGFSLERLGAEMPKEWFKAVTILDTLTVHMPMPLEALPAMCASIISIVRKVDTSEFKGWLPHIAEHAQELADSLRSRGSAVPDIIHDILIAQQELRIITSLGWQVDPPSCETWLFAFCSRFSALERSLNPAIQWVWQHSLKSARYICIWLPACKTCTPGCLARGIICIHAIAANLVPAGHLKPDHVEPEDWMQTLGLVTAASAMESQDLHGYCSSLLIATGTEHEVLKEDTHAVLMLMRHITTQHQNVTHFNSI